MNKLLTATVHAPAVFNRRMAALAAFIALLAGAAVAAGSDVPVDDASLSYEVNEGLNLNLFLQQGQVAAHLVLRSGKEPRVLVAFPAGDSGAGVWFEPLAEAASWTSSGPLRAVTALDDKGRSLHGVTAEVAIRVPELRIRQGILSSVRMLRDYQLLGTVSPSIAAQPSVHEQSLVWARERLDGAVSYRLSLEVLHGTLSGEHIEADADGRIGLRVSALTGETPLSPLPASELLTSQAVPDGSARNALSFLAYQEKLLAGSWRFDTYFGRDTLMSVRLLMPVLQPQAIEAGLDSVLTRLSPLGEVAHEEDIGERAVVDHLAADGSSSPAPVFDYKMIDGNYLLAPVIAAWLLDDARGRARASAFLGARDERPDGATRTRGAALLDNLRYVLDHARAFSIQPTTRFLIALKPGISVGEWRDSETGLGGGRYPYDVDAVLVPAALEAAARLQSSGLLDPYEQPGDRERLSRAAAMALVWRQRAPALFDVLIGHGAAVRAIAGYAAELRLPAHDALGALPAQGLRFHALALDAAGRPVRVMNSDEGFALLFGHPEAVAMDRHLATLMQPFPAGLMTGAGLLVANPVACAPVLRAQLDRNAYHGTVIWSWQQALMAAGLAHQLQREDLPGSVRTDLLRWQRGLWDVIRATQSMQSSELWSWTFVSGRFAVAPFGVAAADADESNAAQLWSTVYLALRPPS